jgi:hypothetical protein
MVFDLNIDLLENSKRVFDSFTVAQIVSLDKRGAGSFIQDPKAAFNTFLWKTGFPTAYT